MTDFPKLSPFGERLAIAGAVGLMVTLAQVGTDIRDGKLTMPRIVYRLMSFPMLAYVAAFIAGRLGLSGELNGMAAIAVFVVGAEGIERWGKAVFARYTGMPEASGPRVQGAAPPPDLVSPTPGAPPLADVREAPIANLGARYMSDETQRTQRHGDPDADVIRKLDIDQPPEK